jgi:hypothetical protein
MRPKREPSWSQPFENPSAGRRLPWPCFGSLSSHSMKEFEVTVTLPADPQTALRVLYSDGAFFSAYHAKVGDVVREVSDWDAATKTRTVCFMKRLDIPAPIARVLGTRAPPGAGAAVRGEDGCAGAAARALRLAAACRAPRELTACPRLPRAGDITSLNVQDVQVLASAGDAGGAGATVTSTPNVGVKARAPQRAWRAGVAPRRARACVARHGRCPRWALTRLSFRRRLRSSRRG